MDSMDKNPAVRRILARAGIVLIGLLGIILLGGDKVTSGTMLIITSVVMALPLHNNRLLYRIRIGYLCVVFGFVIWNISTTQTPHDGMIYASPNTAAEHRETASTGVRFLDQLIHIFNGFLEGRLIKNILGQH